jgi:hypothetical protein
MLPPDRMETHLIQTPHVLSECAHSGCLWHKRAAMQPGMLAAAACYQNMRGGVWVFGGLLL